MLSIYILIEGVRQNQSTWPVSDNAVRPLCGQLSVWPAVHYLIAKLLSASI